MADDWQARPERAAVEARAAAVLARLLPPGAVLAPLHVDAKQHLFVMPCAPAGAETWKEQLMRGELREGTAARVGELLGLLHARSRAEPALAAEFADREFFLSLRVEPYLDTVAARRPELAPAIARHRRRLLANRECLVHGDFSPKNLLVAPDDPAAVILLDHEVAHWGDPAFDLAFCLTHLHAKALAFPERAAGYLALAGTFWRAYLAAASPVAPAGLERHTVGLLGCLLAARVDGKSPLEYLTREEQKESVRALARTAAAGRTPLPGRGSRHRPAPGRRLASPEQAADESAAAAQVILDREVEEGRRLDRPSHRRQNRGRVSPGRGARLRFRGATPTVIVVLSPTAGGRSISSPVQRTSTPRVGQTADVWPRNR